MKWFNDLKVGTKLLSGFLLVAIIAGVVGVIGAINIRKTNTKYVELYEEYGVALGDMATVSIQYQITRNYLKDMVLEKDSAQKGKYVEKIKEYEDKINQNLLVYEKSIRSDQERKEYENIKTLMNNFMPLKDQVINFVLTNQEEQALALLKGEGAQVANEVKTAVDNLFLNKKANGAKLAEEYSANTEGVIKIMIVIAIFAVILAIFLGILISRLISKPVYELVNDVNKIAEGDLDVYIEANTNDEVGNLLKAVKKMTDNINDILTNINSSSEQVAAGAKQISVSSTVLSQGATEQASSIEETTAAIEEISIKTKKNAQDAEQADQLAGKVIEDAAEGNLRMKEMLKSMEEINISSNNISKIIKVIDEIAFQTNILALNAAVEAARAGQHGKGFAVVAEEVRNLAARSANAAKETTEMIEGSIQKVHSGTIIANETATALNNIVEEVAKVAALIKDINIASNVQAAGIAQVTQAISQASQVVQNNSATSEEGAAASEELSALAELLKQQVNRFKLKKNNNVINGVSGLNPEILKVLENLAENKKTTHDSAFEESNNEKPVKICLSDKEFGKY